MRKLFVTIFVLLLFVPAILAGEFWGSKNSNKYHYPDCKWAQKINPKNLIRFNSPEEAQKAGYIPCKVCRPPVSSKSELNTDIKPTLIHFQTNDSEERRGCCSWHGGVCGCDVTTGRVICCDGTLSPSCGC